MSRRTTADRIAGLIEAVDTAEEVRALARHPAVSEWFKSYERAAVEAILSAQEENERVSAIARVHAVRSLAAHLTAIESAVQPALRRIAELREDENKHG